MKGALCEVRGTARPFIKSGMTGGVLLKMRVSRRWLSC